LAFGKGSLDMLSDFTLCGPMFFYAAFRGWIVVVRCRNARLLRNPAINRPTTAAPNARNGTTMPTLLSPFQNNASGNQHDASSPENNQPDNGRPLNLSLIERCIERNKDEKEDSDLSYAFAQQFKTIAQFMPFSILYAGWGIAQDA